MAGGRTRDSGSLPYAAIADRVAELAEGETIIVRYRGGPAFDRYRVSQALRAVLRQHGMFAKIAWCVGQVKITRRTAALYERPDCRRKE